MLSGYDAEQLSSIEAEDALADEFCEWVRSWQTVPAEGSTPERVLSGARLEALLGIGRIRIMLVMNNRLRGERGWRQANQLVRRGWLANRERWLLMGLAELEVEEEERKRKKGAASLGAEAEVHDDDAPYATADDVVALPAAGVSVETLIWVLRHWQAGRVRSSRAVSLMGMLHSLGRLSLMRSFPMMPRLR